MISDRPTLNDLAAEMARVVRRHPEYRMRPGRDQALGPLRLLGVVAGNAVVRGNRSAPSLVGLSEFDAWPLCDKDGVIANAD